MKKYLFTGLAILMPLVLTIWVAKFVIGILTQPFAGAIASMLSHYGFPAGIATGASQIIGLFLFLAAVFVLGVVGRWYIIHSLIGFVEYIFHKIPFVSKVYKAVKDVVGSLFHSDAKAFQTVVLVKYPHAGILSIGLVTTDALLHHEGGKEEFISVFVPTTPNPTIGFVLLFNRKDVIFTDLTVREALQLIVSCGAKFTQFGIVNQNYEKHTDHDSER